jgi:hypothetical protein
MQPQNRAPQPQTEGRGGAGGSGVEQRGSRRPGE